MTTVWMNKPQDRVSEFANPYMTKENKTSPLNAPNFCMLLRKYIGNGRISAISQPSMERR